MGGKYDNKEGYLNSAHLFPRVSRYKRGSDIMEGDHLEVGCIIKAKSISPCLTCPPNESNCTAD